MCGSNNREEADRRTVELCPECAAKVWWGLAVDPLSRYRKLADFCRGQGLVPEAEFYGKLMAAIEKAPR